MYSLSPYLPQFQQSAGATSLFVGEQALWWEGEHLAMIPKISPPPYSSAFCQNVSIIPIICVDSPSGARKIIREELLLVFLYFYFDAKKTFRY